MCMSHRIQLLMPLLLHFQVINMCSGQLIPDTTFSFHRPELAPAHRLNDGVEPSSANSTGRRNTLVEVLRRPAEWMQKLTGRGAMRSPGAPSLRNEIERLFWVQIATGITSEKAAQAVGVCINSYRHRLVPSSGRDAIIHVEQHIRTILIVRRAKGDWAASSAKYWRS